MFDFDGTLADSGQVVEESLAKIALKYKQTKISIKDLKHKRAKGFLGKLKFAYILLKNHNKFNKMYKKNLERIDFFLGAEDLLQKTVAKGYRVVILSSNKKNTIRRFLELKGIFLPIEIISSQGLFGKHKTIRKFCKNNSLKPDSILYIGDEIRDVKACNKADVDFCFVEWGVDQGEDLSDYQVSFSVKSPQELLGVLNI